MSVNTGFYRQTYALGRKARMTSAVSGSTPRQSENAPSVGATAAPTVTRLTHRHTHRYTHRHTDRYTHHHTDHYTDRYPTR